MTLIKGDGIGPEISQAVIGIFQAAEVRSIRYFDCAVMIDICMAGSSGMGECECGPC